MPRALSISALCLSLLGAPAVHASGPADAGTPAPAAATPPASQSIDPELLEEARSLLPPPLLYGHFRPQVGTFVEYEVTSPQKAKSRVRVAVVGRTERATGEAMYQVEFHAPHAKPPTLVVLWVVGDARPMVERLAVSVAPHAPISIPVDLYLDLPELRGTPTGEAALELKGGTFAGKALRRGYKNEKGATTEVVSTDKVPLFGVQTVRGPLGTWVAQKSGTGATPELTTVPVSVPRFPRVE
jgi:hypothetical protein